MGNNMTLIDTKYFKEYREKLGFQTKMELRHFLLQKT